jgi:hypothetical protein
MSRHAAAAARTVAEAARWNNVGRFAIMIADASVVILLAARSVVRREGAIRRLQDES